MSKYILVDEYTHEELKGKPKYFKQMTAIGPMATPELSEAMIFDTRDAAAKSGAFSHWSANWELKELPPTPLQEARDE